jgi:ATP-dependent Clp protease protease subunit
MTEDLKLVAEAKLFEQQMLKEVQLTDKTRLEADELRAVALRNNSSDFRNRVYNFLGPISLESVEKAANTILGWDRASQDPITLRLMSPGGEVPSGLYLFDLLASMAKLGTPIRTVAIGNANSMAAVVLQAGTHRVVGENSWITLHEVSVSGNPFESMTVSEKEEQDKTVRRINTRLVRILASRMTISIEQLSKNIKKKDWTLEPEEAIRYGLADTIGYK